MLGRRPGKGFDTAHYLETYPDVAGSGLNPLVHYLLHGKREGRHPRPVNADGAARAEVGVIRAKLLGLGFTDEPLAELGARADASRPCPYAARELALWHMRARHSQGYQTALHYIARARMTAPDLDFRSRLTTAELLCHHFLGQETEGCKAHAQAALRGEMSPDAMLAWVNFQPTPEARCRWINHVLRRFDIPPVALMADAAAPYDRLTSAKTPPPVRAAGAPRVTVLLAAYAAAATLPTALRSLREQTWRNLEIIVIDDASPDNGATVAVAEGFAARDPRIRVLRMLENRGAYVARNRGLDEATGDYVTIHDADDWSHPAKIETQVRFMEANPEVMGCTSEQARAADDLAFTRWTGRPSFIIRNVSSFLFRRRPMRAELGYWDTVRFSADSELIRRMIRVFGASAIRDLQTGPLSFQRDSGTSIVADEVLGMNGFYFGARKDYFDAQRHHHRSGASLKYTGDPGRRPFPVPAMMRPDRERLLARPRHFDVVLYGDFRLSGPELEKAVAEVRALRAAGKTVGIVELLDYDLPAARDARIHSALRDEVDGDSVQVLVFGDSVSCDKRVGDRERIASLRQRYLPEVVERPEGDDVIDRVLTLSSYGLPADKITQITGIISRDGFVLSPRSMREIGKAVRGFIAPLEIKKIRQVLYVAGRSERTKFDFGKLPQMEWYETAKLLEEAAPEEAYKAYTRAMLLNPKLAQARVRRRKVGFAPAPDGADIDAIRTLVQRRLKVSGPIKVEAAEPIREGFSRNTISVVRYRLSVGGDIVPVVVKEITRKAKRLPREVAVHDAFFESGEPLFRFPRLYGWHEKPRTLLYVMEGVGKKTLGMKAWGLALGALASQQAKREQWRLAEFLRDHPPMQQALQKAFDVRARLEEIAALVPVQADALAARIELLLAAAAEGEAGDLRLAHDDAQLPNLRVDATGTVVLTDFSSMTLKPPGHDLAKLVSSCWTRRVPDPASWTRRAEQALEGYLEGLRQTGECPDEAQVRAGFRAGVGELVSGNLRRMMQSIASGHGPSREAIADKVRRTELLCSLMTGEDRRPGPGLRDRRKD
jgi:glycosyltransferase involved in cell wall biosynthesis